MSYVCTAIVALVPLMVVATATVAVIVWLPAVFSITLVNVCVPAKKEAGAPKGACI